MYRRMVPKTLGDTNQNTPVLQIKDTAMFAWSALLLFSDEERQLLAWMMQEARERKAWLGDQQLRRRASDSLLARVTKWAQLAASLVSLCLGIYLISHGGH